VSTESANFTSGNLNSGFTDKGNTIMVIPVIKVRGAEFFGMHQVAKGRAAPNPTPTRDVTQRMAEGTYRLLPGEKRVVAARWNRVTGNLGGVNTLSG